MNTADTRIMDNDVIRIRKAKRIMKKYALAESQDAKARIINQNGYSCYQELEYDAVDLERERLDERLASSPTGFIR